MKFGIIILCTLCMVQSVFGQRKLEISELDDSRLIRILNNSILLEENRDNSLVVKVYEISNGSGSAGLAEGHEVSHNLLVAVSEFDEYPLQKLFKIGPFINPKFVKWIGKMEVQKEFEIEYGVYNNRKSIFLNVNINELILK